MTDSTPKLTAAQFQALLLGSKCDGLVTTGGLVPLVTARALVKRGLLSCLEANAFLLTDDANLPDGVRFAVVLVDPSGEVADFVEPYQNEVERVVRAPAPLEAG